MSVDNVVVSEEGEQRIALCDLCDVRLNEYDKDLLAPVQLGCGLHDARLPRQQVDGA